MEENKKVLVWILVAIALFILFGSFGMGGYCMMGFGMGFGFIFMILFWGIVIWLIISLINSAQSNNHGKSDEDASSILKKRYASGKISKKEYEEMKKELK